MTKEELEKEAEKYVKQNYCEMCVMADDCKCGCIDCFTVQAYLASAEPREKQIEIDAKQIRALQKQNGELTDKLEMGIALKDEEISCILTDFNTFKSEAKEIIRDFLSVAIDYIDKEDKNYSYIVEAEQFLNSEVEK